jgi:anti-sigma regulatory factor (Ser/Thr protein kinase)
MRELSLHILDLLENAVEAEATCVEVRIDEDLAADQMSISVRDNGRGMDQEIANRALDPFFTTRTTRHVGLGLPLLAAAAQRCEGGVQLESVPEQGTRVTATFRHSHLDRAPLGNVADTLLACLLAGDGRAPQLCFQHSVNGTSFTLDTAAIQAEVGDIPLSYPPLRNWLRDLINEGEAELASLRGGQNAKAQDN